MAALMLMMLVSASTARPQASAPIGAASRAGLIASMQSDKSTRLKAYEPDRAEAIIHKMEKIFLLDPSGFYPYFSSVYPGGGLTGGAGYRRFFGDKTNWYVQGLYSVANYKLLEGGVQSKDHLNRRLSFGTRLGWRDATQVPYYGLGISTNPDDRTNFRFQQTTAEGNTTYKPIPWIVMKGGLGYEHWALKPGAGTHPSIETVHTPATAPGLGVSPTYIHSHASAGIDWRRSPGYARRGGLYQVTLDDYNSVTTGSSGFQKLTGEVVQHVPLMRETWVLAARGKVETLLNDNDLVPYFMLPSLGGGHNLRGYANDRFRDRHSMLMNAEFRWTPAIGLDMAVFYDAGKVASRRNDLSFQGLKSDVGIGARFHGLAATPLRLDFAVGNEGWRMVLSGGPPF